MYSFRDPVTGVLKAKGWMAANEPGDIRQEEADSFSLERLKWRWDGLQWVPVVPSSVLPSSLARALDVAISTPTLATIRIVLQEWRKRVS